MAQDHAALSRRIKEEAQRLGFELVGISAVQIPPHEQSFAEWLRGDLFGELDYMKRTEELRRHPQRLAPWARSIVSVAMNYYTPFPRPEASHSVKGWISRYAFGGMTTIIS
jgi:epoxyqueuosine reductase